MSHAAFLNAIREAPEDDTARLVYADFLDEQGSPADAARAEFIRLQVRLAALDETAPDRPALEDRENELLRAHERAWVGRLTPALAHGLHKWRFARGFLDHVNADAKALAPSGGPFFQRHPVGSVELAPDSSTPDAYTALGSRKWWAHVRALDTGDSSSAGPEVVEPVLASKHLTGLRRLALNGNGRRNAAVSLADALARCPSLPTLRELEVRDSRADVAGLLPVLEECGVEKLTLSHCHLTLRGLKALLTSSVAARLSALELQHGNLDGALWPAFEAKKGHACVMRLTVSESANKPDLPTLLSAPAVAKLKALDVSETNLSLTGVRAIAQSDFMGRATELGLTRCNVGPKGMAALARAEAPHLRKLTLGESDLHLAGVAGLCEAPWADSLTQLDLMRNYLDDAALAEMANSGKFLNLRTLDLRVNSPDLNSRCKGAIGDEGVIALASAPNFARLRHLNLYRTRVTARGVEALLNSLYCKLSRLEIGGEYDLGADLPRVLARSPGLARLTKLALSFTPALRDDALMPLAESPHLSPLCELDIRYNNVSDRVNAAFAARLGRRLENYPAVGSW